MISLLYEYFILLMMFLSVLEFIKCLWDLIRLLSDYHNSLRCDRSGSPAVSGSPIPGMLARCSSTGLHGDMTDVFPGGGNSMLEDGPETLFFIAILSTAILFITPSLS